MRRMLVTLVLGGVCSFPVAASASPITISQSQVYSCSSDNSGTSGGCTNDLSITYGPGVVTSSDGTAVATTWRNWIDTGTGALFDFDFDHARPGTRESYAQSGGTLRFTVGSQNTAYTISGFYQAQDVGAPGNVTLSALLRNVASGMNLMVDTSQSINTSNESFTLGMSGDGDNINTTGGALTGTLFAGQTYELQFTNYIYASPDADSGASATGCLTLSIGGATGAGNCGKLPSVPDGGISTAGLLAVGLAALAFALHRA